MSKPADGGTKVSQATTVPSNQLDVALRRLHDEGQLVDPEGAVARFNSAF